MGEVGTVVEGNFRGYAKTGVISSQDNFEYGNFWGFFMLWVLAMLLVVVVSCFLPSGRNLRTHVSVGAVAKADKY